MTSFSGSILHIDSQTISRVTLTHQRLQRSPVITNKTNNNDRDYDSTKTQYTSSSLSPSSNSCRAMEKNFSMIRTLYITASESVKLHSFSLSIFVSLQELYIDSCPPSTIDGLYDFRNQLKILKIINSGIPELVKALAPGVTEELLKHYKPIVLDTCSSDIASNLKWSQVSELKLSNCGITRLDQSMHLFPSVQMLDLSRNDISHIIHLQDCYSLRDLNLSYNRISVLSNVGRVLGNVITLNISHNLIVSLDGIGAMYSLQTIDCSHNAIDDFCEVRHLINLPCLEHIILEGNVLCENALYRLMVFTQLLNGSLLTSDRSLPTLDRKGLLKTESRQLRGLMFRPPENHQKSSTISRDYGTDKRNIVDFDESILLDSNSSSSKEEKSFKSPLKISNFAKQGIISSSVRETKRKTKNDKLRRNVEIFETEQIPEFVDLDLLRLVLQEVRCMSAADIEAKHMQAEEVRLKELALFQEEERRHKEILKHELMQKLQEDDKLMERNKVGSEYRTDSVESASASQRMGRFSSDSSTNMVEVDLIYDETNGNNTKVSDVKYETPTRKSSLSFFWKGKFLSSPSHSGKDSNKIADTSIEIVDKDDEVFETEEEEKYDDYFEKGDDSFADIDSLNNSNVYEFSDVLDGTNTSYSQQYIGNPQYLDYIVLGNIELYLNEQIFNTLEESPYLRLKGHDSNNGYKKVGCTNNSLKPEKVQAHYCEQVVDIKANNNKPHDVEDSKVSPKKKKNVDVEDIEISMLIVLTDINLYMIMKDSIKHTATFKDAPIPVLLRYHPLYLLESCSIFFSFQRCIFTFSSETANNTLIDTEDKDNITQENYYSYSILPRDKSRTSKLITKIPQCANIERINKLTEDQRSNVKIINRDSQLLENISGYTKNIGMYPDIIHYQMLFQIKRSKSNLTHKACTIILTSDLLFLFRENFSIDDVDTSLIDSASYKDILKIEIDKNNPLILITVLKPKKVFYSKRQWSLTAENPATIIKLHDELKKQL